MEFLPSILLGVAGGGGYSTLIRNNLLSAGQLFKVLGEHIHTCLKQGKGKNCLLMVCACSIPFNLL